jgi:hypothetical protein
VVVNLVSVCPLTESFAEALTCCPAAPAVHSRSEACLCDALRQSQASVSHQHCADRSAFEWVRSSSPRLGDRLVGTN